MRTGMTRAKSGLDIRTKKCFASAGSTLKTSPKAARSISPEQRRPIVANLANVPTVKFENFSKRDPKKLFYL